VTPTNRELVAQGLGNMVSGLIGGLPITQVIVRSSANINFGAKTKMSAILHGVFLLISALTIAGLMNRIPLASLAAILLMVGYKLAKPALFKQMYKLGWEQFVPFTATVVAILLTDLLRGIAIGLAVGIFYTLGIAIATLTISKMLKPPKMGVKCITWFWPRKYLFSIKPVF
jgi:SulP family sulfate permease